MYLSELRGKELGYCGILSINVHTADSMFVETVFWV